MKTLLKSALAVSFSLTMLCAIPQIKAASSQQDDTTAKEDMKDAGHSTKRAAKKTGSAAKKGTKKAAHKTARKTRQGAEKVEDKTEPQ